MSRPTETYYDFVLYRDGVRHMSGGNWSTREKAEDFVKSMCEKHPSLTGEVNEVTRDLWDDEWARDLLGRLHEAWQLEPGRDKLRTFERLMAEVGEFARTGS